MDGRGMTDLHYHVIRSRKRRRTLSLQVKEDGRIVIHAPFLAPEREIENFLRRNHSWIIKKLEESKRSIGKGEKEFLPGERFFFLGEAYPLEIGDAGGKEIPLRLSFGRFILGKDHVEKARELFMGWYRKEAEEKLVERVRYYSNKLQLFPKDIRITSAKYRWGSCSADDRLSFSWRIIMTSFKIIDYVLIHELVHIREKNHSRRFWTCLGSIVPDYRDCRRWLKENGSSLWF